MVRSIPIKIEEHELNDPKWWVGRHKENLS